MADNVAITAGVGTTVASDDIGGVQYQRVKLGLGADGTAVDAVAGAGAVSTGVQRVTLASDDPAVVALQEAVTALPAMVPEPIAGTNLVQQTKVSQTGAGTVAIQAIDGSNKWDIVGWKLSFSAACTLTVTMSATTSNILVFDIPGACVWDLPPAAFAHFTGGAGEAISIANSAGNMKGIVYTRKHA